jgi:selenide,water dikinase
MSEQQVRLTTLSHGAGCGCKIGPEHLRQVIKFLPPTLDPNVLVGINTSDDAGVYKLTDDIAAVLTLDFFTPIVDDPYDFGRIAVTNAVSDVYAMGGTPVIGLNVVAFPARELPLSILEEILRGGADQARAAGVSVVGGHSIDDPEPKFGFVAMGIVHPDKVITNAGARVGDLLYFTKPIGTGVISTAVKRGAAAPEQIAESIKWMTTLNKDASEVMRAVGVNACTDVTGFSLLGHLYEMTCGSGVGARVRMDDIPTMGGVRELLAQDMAPGGAYRNLEFLEKCGAIIWERSVTEEDKLLLCDPQTAGGLLLSVPPENADELKHEMVKAGVPAVEIGEVVEDGEGRIWIT